MNSVILHCSKWKIFLLKTRMRRSFASEFFSSRYEFVLLRVNLMLHWLWKLSFTVMRDDKYWQFYPPYLVCILYELVHNGVNIFFKFDWYFASKIVLTYCEKNRSSDWGKFLILLEQFIRTVKGFKQNSFLTCYWRFPRSNTLEQL